MRHRRLGDEPLQSGVVSPFDRTTTSGNWISQYAACWRLLEAVRQRYPQVLADLEQYLVAFPVSANAPDAYQLDDLTPEVRTAHWRDREPKIEWLRAWPRRHRLAPDLILKAGCETVTAWQSDSIARRERRWAFPDVQY